MLCYVVLYKLTDVSEVFTPTIIRVIIAIMMVSVNLQMYLFAVYLAMLFM
jgi:hypothetical protein